MFILSLIYFAFISLGLPDGLFGSAWPALRRQLGLPLSYAGIVTMIIAFCASASGLFADRLTRKFGAGKVTAASAALSAMSLFGFSISGRFWHFCLWAVPYGFCGGSVDAALNNEVAQHYKSRHMNWLHCMWGIGASAGPLIMGFSLSGPAGWSGGYRTVAIIQIAFAAVMFASLPVWKRRGANPSEAGAGGTPPSLRSIFNIRGVKPVFAAFFCYCSLEGTAGLWAGSYLAVYRGVSAETAARFASFFYIGITAGRFLCGLISDRAGNKNMIRLGAAVSAIGALAVLIPVTTDIFSLFGLIVIGIGCAPIYPAIVHSTPDNFGRGNSQAIIGAQMAFAYMGMTLTPPLFGWLASNTGIGLYPVFLLALIAIISVLTERVNRITRGAFPSFVS